MAQDGENAAQEKPQGNNGSERTRPFYPSAQPLQGQIADVPWMDGSARALHSHELRAPELTTKLRYRPNQSVKAARRSKPNMHFSAASAHRLLRLAEENDIAIIEDDIYADFEEVAASRRARPSGSRRLRRKLFEDAFGGRACGGVVGVRYTSFRAAS